MIDKAKGINTSSLVLGQSSTCPGPPHYLLPKTQQNDHYQDPHQPQCSYNQANHCRPYPHYHYNQVLPQQARQPPQQPQQLMPQQNQPQNHYQLTLQPLPQLQFPQQTQPQQNSAPQQPSTSVWTSNTSQHQHHQHQHSLYQNTQHHHHHHQQTPQNTNTTTTSQHHHYQTQTQAASSPAEHLHPLAQEMTALAEEKARLEAQLRELRDRRRCVVCLDKDQGAIFMPCSHLVTCPSCAVTLATCPVCRTPVHYLVPVTID